MRTLICCVLLVTITSQICGQSAGGGNTTLEQDSYVPSEWDLVDINTDEIADRNDVIELMALLYTRFDSACLYSAAKESNWLNLEPKTFRDSLRIIAVLIRTRQNCDSRIDSNRRELIQSLREAFSTEAIEGTDTAYGSLTVSDISLIIRAEEVIKGRVVDVRNRLSGKRYYRSEYLVEVTRVLDWSDRLEVGDTIILKKETGVETGQENVNRLLWTLFSGSSIYRLGDESLFFLSSSDHLGQSLNYRLSHSDAVDEVTDRVYTEYLDIYGLSEYLIENGNDVESFIKSMSP